MLALSEGETSRCLNAAKSDKLSALFAVLLGTGIDPGEALALKWSDFDPINHTLERRREPRTATSSRHR